MEMCGSCQKLTGLFVLLAGAALLAPGLNMLPAATGTMIGGVLLFLAGLSYVMHAMNMCPQCPCGAKKK